ncbi:MAG: hypothetical protein F8N37_07060 [Telmatospirillum sp.]|nr:hypothetical protein [Telmatospirillum sp.]
MPMLVVLVILFALFHFLLFLPTAFAILLAAVSSVFLWLLWKLKWIILGIIGLEAVFGGRDDEV